MAAPKKQKKATATATATALDQTQDRVDVQLSEAVQKAIALKDKLIAVCNANTATIDAAMEQVLSGSVTIESLLAQYGRINDAEFARKSLEISELQNAMKLAIAKTETLTLDLKARRAEVRQETERAKLAGDRVDLGEAVAVADHKGVISQLMDRIRASKQEETKAKVIIQDRTTNKATRRAFNALQAAGLPVLPSMGEGADVASLNAAPTSASAQSAKVEA